MDVEKTRSGCEDIALHAVVQAPEIGFANQLRVSTAHTKLAVSQASFDQSATEIPGFE